MDDSNTLINRLAELKHAPLVVSTETLDGHIRRTRAECQRCHASAKILYNIDTGTVMMLGEGTTKECAATA